MNEKKLLQLHLKKYSDESYHQIAARLGISKTKLIRLIKEYNIPRRKWGRKRIKIKSTTL